MPTRLYAFPAQLPTAGLTARFGWAPFLALLPGDSIATFEVTADPGITLGTATIDDAEVYVRISGGTAGQTYKVTCTVVTANNETDSMVATVTVANAA